ncbi:hypothetical protein [Meiothermus granaticius]|uniref:Uncharacterized protein n=1 Tax=Meiothermus granaticius NBRC 107808 TaxID=1227551 RepID=A0A399FC17_9DEIN|nr:hypothetical protein [Meiothermus granaticius]MCL6526796.1 hypothetical protein [Thermaceae bacterium]RIH92502.1 hypothetical protein Mgrana_01534 [Meiothermus granaticius NBRC 107808]GEM86990.1 hypothetical protein MGR01S_16150 [Meiothermus granaticius NBRC 107808]
MKPIKLVAVMFGLGMLVSCGNFTPRFNVPSLRISAGTSTPQYGTDANGQPVLVGLSVTYYIRNLAGSPGGTINSLNLVGGGTIPGAEVRPCPADAQEQAPDSDPCVVTQTLSYAQASGIPARDSIKVESYEVVSDSGQVTTVTLPTPITLY